MKKFTLFFVVSLLIAAFTLQGQSLINTSWKAVHKVDNTSWKLEFLTGDSLFMTGYDANGNVNNIRAYFGTYQQANDTVTFNFLSWHPCGIVSGVYTFSISNNRIYWTLVSDPCTARSSFFVSSYNHFCIICNIGIDEEESTKQSFQLYPNPASHSITIENLYQPFDANSEVVLYDLLGNKLLQKHFGEAGNTYQLHVGYLNAGVYILQVVNENDVFITERVIIQ